jgi:polyphosphate kinase
MKQKRPYIKNIFQQYFMTLRVPSQLDVFSVFPGAKELNFHIETKVRQRNNIAEDKYILTPRKLLKV